MSREAVLAKQGGRCALCGSQVPPNGGTLQERDRKLRRSETRVVCVRCAPL